MDTAQEMTSQPPKAARLAVDFHADDEQMLVARYMDDTEFDQRLQIVLKAHSPLLAKLAE